MDLPLFTTILPVGTKKKNICIYITAISVAEKMQSMLSGLLFLTVVVVVSSRVFFLIFFLPISFYFTCTRPKHSHDACVRAIVYILCSMSLIILYYNVSYYLYIRV
uniref:Uncharacterized protein n=1 Tax=Schizaphis graminum TaxID=13262 RepID=A0A2S2P040_SCHGA